MQGVAFSIACDREETLNLDFISLEHWFLNDVIKENAENEK